MKRNTAFITIANFKLVLISQEKNGNQQEAMKANLVLSVFSRGRTLRTRLQQRVVCVCP